MELKVFFLEIVHPDLDSGKVWGFSIFSFCTLTGAISGLPLLKELGVQPMGRCIVLIAKISELFNTPKQDKHPDVVKKSENVTVMKKKNNSGGQETLGCEI